MTAAKTGINFDYFRLDDELTGDEMEVRDRVRAFAEQQRVLPVINEYWEKAEPRKNCCPTWLSWASSARLFRATAARA